MLRIALSGAGTKKCSSMEEGAALKLYEKLHKIQSYKATRGELDLFDGDGKHLFRLNRLIL